MIPTWKAPDLTSKAIDHLTRNGFPRWAELIIVDDGSQDDTAALIRARFPHLTVIEHELNRGFGAAVNTGFKAARGGFLAAVNNDALVSWEGLERLMQFLETTPRAAAAAPQIVDRTGRRQRVGYHFPRAPWHRLTWLLLRRHASATPTSSVGPYPAEYLRGACVVFNRTALEYVGLFDEQFHMFAEEIDLFRRLCDAGWTAWVVQDVVATHFAGMSTRNHNDPLTAARFRRQSYLSMCLYYRKHHSWAASVLLRALLAARVSGQLVGSLGPDLIRTGPRRRPGEYLGYLATVLRRLRIGSLR